MRRRKPLRAVPAELLATACRNGHELQPEKKKSPAASPSAQSAQSAQSEHSGVAWKPSESANSPAEKRRQIRQTKQMRGLAPFHGCCWETFYMFAYCG